MSGFKPRGVFFVPHQWQKILLKRNKKSMMDMSRFLENFSMFLHADIANDARFLD